MTFLDENLYLGPLLTSLSDKTLFSSKTTLEIIKQISFIPELAKQISSTSSAYSSSSFSSKDILIPSQIMEHVVILAIIAKQVIKFKNYYLLLMIY